MRALVFAKRNIKEILRDPMSYVFCLGFPIIMLVAFYTLFYSETFQLFAIDNLAPGIAIFSFAFVMLFMALLVSKDRATSLLSRLYVSPMTTVDFVLGYSIPGLIIAFGQVTACFLTAGIMGLLAGTPLSLAGIILAILSTIPAMFLFIGLGILFGSLLSDKAAPGISSIVITLAGFLSGAWTPVEALSALGAVASVFPFYPAVSVGRMALSMDQSAFANSWSYLLIICAYALVVFILSVFAFSRKTRSDNG
jgi:ABC-2 type transport system permease protein